MPDVTIPPMTVRELCERLRVDCPAELAAVQLHGINTVELATDRDATFVARGKFAAGAEQSAAAIVIVPKDVAVQRGGVLSVPDVWDAVLTLLEHFHPAPVPTAYRHPTAIVPDSCRIGENVHLSAQVVLGEGVTIGAGTRIGPGSAVGDGTVIGAGCLLHPRVTVMHGCVIGNRVILHSGAVIGSDGFKYEVTRRRLCKIPQVGNVVLEDDVEIGANACIDRASFASTRIGARTKIDNLVQIAHNVEIGSDSIIVSQTGIAGSTKVGRGVVIAGQVGVKDNVKIGDGCKIGGRSGIDGDLPAGSEVIGWPAMPLVQWGRLMAVQRRLPEIYKKLRPLLKEED